MATQGSAFDERKQDQPIVFKGSANEVNEGCVVELEVNGERITAKVTEGTGQPWVGEITGFPNEDVDQLGELQLGDTVKFEQQNIFRCAA